MCLQYSSSRVGKREREREQASVHADDDHHGAHIMAPRPADSLVRRTRGKRKKKTGVGIGYFCQRNASNNEPCAIASVHSAACGTPSYLLTYLLTGGHCPSSLPLSLPTTLIANSHTTHTHTSNPQQQSFFHL